MAATPLSRNSSYRRPASPRIIHIVVIKLRSFFFHDYDEVSCERSWTDCSQRQRSNPALLSSASQIYRTDPGHHGSKQAPHTEPDPLELFTGYYGIDITLLCQIVDVRFFLH